MQVYATTPNIPTAQTTSASIPMVGASVTMLRMATRRALALSTRRHHAPVRSTQSPLAVRMLSQQQRRAFSTEKITVIFIDSDGQEIPVTADAGQTLLDVAHDNDIELEGACGGELACSTCHLVFEKEVFDKLPEISEEEEDMLDLAWGLTDTSRLGCQICLSKDLEGARIRVPDETDNLM